MTILKTLLDHAAMLEQWTLCTVEDVPDDEFTDQPHGMTNHPAWVLGHLTFAMDNLTRALGGTVSRDESWAEPFTSSTAPSGERSDYPSKEELISAFSDSCRSVREAVRRARESRFGETPENERIAAFFPTMGRWMLHSMLIEMPFHTGQLSSWRRVKGMPSVFDNEQNLQRMTAATPA